MNRNRGGHRGRGRQAAPQNPAPVTPERLLEEAETLQQRAERRSGAEALQAFEAAASKYRAAIAAELAADSQADASFGLGECLQLWADGRLQLLQQASDEQLAQDGYSAQATAAATEAYQSSVLAYQQVQVASGSLEGGQPTQLRPDAAVNAANALSSWAELVQGQQKHELLQQAVELYRSALHQEEDALTLSNLADALVALGEAALAVGHTAAGQSAFESAVQSYQASCSLSDSSAGDDLPGLLHNWGVGLHTISKHAQDAQLKKSLLEQAGEKLKTSLQFGRADADPANAYGDCIMDAAELLVQLHSSSSSQEAGSSVFGGQTPLPADVAAQAATLMKQAADDGYMAALTINRTNADALVGLAEANVAMFKLFRRQGSELAATEHIHAAVGHYKSALLRPQLLGNAAERADVRYNAACAAALAGPAHHELAQQVLQALAASGHLQIADAAADEDLAPLRGQPWFENLLAGLTQQR